jgi:tetratricopeptide (TPR) repeat protein
MNATTTTTASEPTSRIARPAPPTHDRVAGLHVLRLEGDFYEMGHQHGTLLADAVKAGPVPYYRRMVERLAGKPLGRLAPALTQLVQRGVGARVARAMPGFARETIFGIADGAGIPRAEMMRGCTMPDALLWAVARLNELSGPGPAVAHRLRLGLGCTSAIAWGSATADGKLYHARNFDYHGVENWANHAAVLFYRPKDGMRYVSVGAAGIGLGGATAMNEAGLSLTVHQHMFTDRARLGGTPIGVVGDLVMRRARSLDEAEAILAAHTPIGCWTYLVTSAHEKGVLCHEESPDRHAARRTTRSDTTFGYANIYLDPELGATELATYGSYWRHNARRHARVNELLTSGAGALDAAGMASILADTGDRRCRIAGSIAMVMTVGSVVFRPEDGAFWVGTGDAPTSRGVFAPFSLEKEGHAPELGELRTGGADDAGADDAFESYRQAYVAYVDHGDVAAARDAAERAVQRAPEQAIYRALSGLLSIELGEPAAARRAFDAAIAAGHPDEERVASFHLWRARASDLAGLRESALKDYRACIGRHADAPVHAAAKKGLRRSFRLRDARRMHVEMAFADVTSP